MYTDIKITNEGINITGQATLDFAGHLSVNTQENQEYIASNLRAGSLSLNAGGDISLTALALTSESRTGSGKNYHNEYHLQHVGTEFAIAGDSKITAAGNVESLGSNVRIGGDSTVAAGGVVHIASLVDVTETESSKTTSKRNAWGTSSTKTTNSFSHTETLSGGTFSAGGKSEFSGDAGIRAEGAKVAAVGGTRFESTEGAIELLGNRTTTASSSVSKYKDAAIQANSASSRTTELAGNTEISGGVEFDEFRRAFWKNVAEDPVLSRAFSSRDIADMSKGLAPRAPKTQSVGQNVKYNLHHETPIQHGGQVYNVDNIRIVTPRYHQEVLDRNYHQGTKR